MNSCKIQGRALLFGLNYDHCNYGKLNGCINDVNQISNYISTKLQIPVETYTDDVDVKNTSYNGIIQKLYDIAIKSHTENLEFVWIHYSGHGSYLKDYSGDESDGYDEGLVPSDYEKKGIVIDDVINRVISLFNPLTKILFICDSCHSGTILDLKFSWNTNNKPKIENSKCKIKSKTILISGCMDNQTSADAWNLLGDYKYIGALTASIIKVLKKSPQQLNDVFSFVNSIRMELKKCGFEQYPCLSTNYDINVNPSMIPNLKIETNDAKPYINDIDVSKNIETPIAKSIPHAPKSIENLLYYYPSHIYYSTPIYIVYHQANSYQPFYYYNTPHYPYVIL